MLVNIFFLGERDIARICLAETRGRLEQSIENGFEIESGSTDDLEDIGSCSLLLKRFAQFAQQPRILNGDDGLRGEVFDQLNLLVSERADFSAIDSNGPDYLVCLEHRHRYDGADAGEFDGGHRQCVSVEISTTFPQ